MNEKLVGLFLLALALFMLSSCNSMIGAGVSRDRGNLTLLDGAEKKTGTGVFLEYRYKKMLEKDTWNKILSRSGLGIDYNLKLRGYSSEIPDDAPPPFFHSIQGKYYYTLIPSSSSGWILDLGLGLGVGGSPVHLDRFFPLISNLTLDLYFPNNDFIVLSSKVNYLNDFKNKTHEFSIEVGIGVHFQKF